MKATHTANYKQIFDMGSNQNLVSLDTGISGNIFGGHYFDMNAGHLKGELLPQPSSAQETDFNLIKKNSYELIMKPQNTPDENQDWVENMLRSMIKK